MLRYFLAAITVWQDKTGLDQLKPAELDAELRSLARLGKQAVDQHPESELPKMTAPLFRAIERLSPGSCQGQMAAVGSKIIREFKGFGLASSVFHVFDAIEQSSPDPFTARSLARLGQRLKPSAARILLAQLARIAPGRECRAIARLGASQSSPEMFHKFALYEISEGRCPVNHSESRSPALQGAIECWLAERQKVLQAPVWSRIRSSISRFLHLDWRRFTSLKTA